MTKQDDHLLSISAENIDDAWEAFIKHAGKVKRKALRVLSPMLISADVRPEDLDQRRFDEHVIRHHMACDDLAEEPRRRGEVNSFARAFSCVAGVVSPPMHVLSGIQGPMDRQRDEKKAFEIAFSSDLDEYKSLRFLGDKEFSSDLNGLFNCWKALDCSGFSISCLRGMLDEDNIVAIKDHYGDGSKKGVLKMGAYLQSLTVLAHLAKHNRDESLRDHLLSRARGLRKKPGITKEEVIALFPYLDDEMFDARMIEVWNEAARAADFPISSTRGAANPIASAIGILIMVFAPASFEDLYRARFVGPQIETGVMTRPSLRLSSETASMTSKGSKGRAGPRTAMTGRKSSNNSIDAPLDDTIKSLIDRFYQNYAKRGVIPEGLFTEPSGEMRSKECAVASVETLLANININLTVLQLRDLGIVRAILAGVPVKQMAHAARLSERAIQQRFEDLEDMVKDIRNNKNV